MALCRCGCGRTTTGLWAPGHDHRKVTASYGKIKAAVLGNETDVQALVDGLYAELPTDDLRRNLTTWLTERGSNEFLQAFNASNVQLPTTTRP